MEEEEEERSLLLMDRNKEDIIVIGMRNLLRSSKLIIYINKISFN